MKRNLSTPRRDWQKKVEHLGLIFHTIDNQPYWDETAFYTFSFNEVDMLEAATNRLSSMYQDAIAYAIERHMLPCLGIPERFVPLVKDSWHRQPPSIYGRFDLAYDGKNPPKLLEFNADTPTSLLEASIIQWEWLQELYPDASQWNSIHERIIDSWKNQQGNFVNGLWFACCYESHEDYMTMTYLRDLAEQVGIKTKEIDMTDIGWCSRRRCFADLQDLIMDNIYKLYPWDWIITDEFGHHVVDLNDVNWIEPAWKMLANSKAMLALLWEMFPNHENLLPCFIGEAKGLCSYAEKPFFSREGSNIRLFRDGNVIDETGGEYASNQRVFQKLYDMPQIDGNYPIFGSWLVDGKSAGLGIRETKRPITDASSRFVPHAISY